MRSFSNLDTVKLGALTRVTNQEINFALQIDIKFPIFKQSVKPETPSITDGVHCNENFVEIIPVFSNFFKKKKNYKSHFI